MWHWGDILEENVNVKWHSFCFENTIWQFGFEVGRQMRFVKHKHWPSPCPKEEKNSTRIEHHMWKILAPTFGKLKGPPLKTSNAKLTKKSGMVGDMRFLYVILTHMVVGTTLHHLIHSIHVDCHLVDRKPHHNIDGNSFKVTCVFKN